MRVRIRLWKKKKELFPCCLSALWRPVVQTSLYEGLFLFLFLLLFLGITSACLFLCTKKPVHHVEMHRPTWMATQRERPRCLREHSPSLSLSLSTRCLSASLAPTGYAQGGRLSLEKRGNSLECQETGSNERSCLKTRQRKREVFSVTSCYFFSFFLERLERLPQKKKMRENVLHEED